MLRRKTRIETIGHAGTLDPFAAGVMVMLIGRPYTRLSNQFLSADKQYRATIQLGQTTDTFDIDGRILNRSDHIPSLSDLEQALVSFQGECLQIPPMFSAKKIGGQKLYDLARKGKTIDRKPVPVRLCTTLIHYAYPLIEIDIACSKGTYIRTLAHDLGAMLGCGAFLSALTRTRSGTFTLSDCIAQESLKDPSFNITPFLRKAIC
ncbi:MAG: truB [Parachlamydiales bacterium]|nr:truB [Parachlamydiales bacterium]